MQTKNSFWCLLTPYLLRYPKEIIGALILEFSVVFDCPHDLLYR